MKARRAQRCSTSHQWVGWNGWLELQLRAPRSALGAAAACFLFLSSLAPAKPGGGRPDIGTYQADDKDPWVPGCTFSPACK